MVNVSIEGSPHVFVNESGSFVEVCVMADHDSEATYEVILSTRDGSATCKQDTILWKVGHLLLRSLSR